jgi:hypothetical protein
MALLLRKAIVRNVVTTTIVCIAFGSVLGLARGSLKLSAANLLWLLILALGIGLFTGWQMIAKIKNGVVKPVSRSLSYMRISRDAIDGADEFDWNTLDDYAVQLETRGFERLGEFVLYPPSKHFAAIASCYVNAPKTIMIEVQHFRSRTPAKPGAAANLNGFHFSIMSLVGGNIRVSTSDHVLKATNYILRGDYSVAASYPGMPLLALLTKHEQLLDNLQSRTGKAASSGLNMERYLLAQRETFRQARQRLNKLSGLDIAAQIDDFEAEPRTNWAPPAEKLAALPIRTMEELDAGKPVQGTPLVVDGAVPAASVDTVRNAQADAFKHQVEQGAKWFYWIAGLSLINTILPLFGSDWGFVIGLGITRVFAALATAMHGEHSSIGLAVVLYCLSFAAVGFFAACGWFARRPSLVAFTIGIAAFALDALIFLIAQDWIGVGFHALALYYLWGGMSAARKFKKVAAAA